MSQGTFNVVRACFWLVAFVIGAHVLAALSAEGMCFWYAQAIVDGKFKCDIDGRLTEIMAAALAAALAFSGGYMSRPTDDKENDQ